MKIIDNSFVTTTNEIFQTISEELQTEYTGRKIRNDFFLHKSLDFKAKILLNNRKNIQTCQIK